MNDFHILSLCVQNKYVAGAMRVLRDKSEFAVRKIQEKIKSQGYIANRQGILALCSGLAAYRVSPGEYTA